MANPGLVFSANPCQTAGFKNIRSDFGLPQPEMAKVMHVGTPMVLNLEYSRRFIPEAMLILAELFRSEMCPMFAGTKWLRKAPPPPKKILRTRRPTMTRTRSKLHPSPS